jgi:hypothetical protein
MQCWWLFGFGKDYKLVLKVNCIVLLIRNLNTKEALVNGTRRRIKFMHPNAIEVLTGTARNKRIFYSTD